MKKSFLKIALMCLSIFILASCGIGKGNNVNKEKGPVLRYELTTDGNSYRIAGIEEWWGGGKDLVIPSTYNDKPVTEIKDSAFKNSVFNDFTSVVIPESVTTISYAAFSGCSALETVTLSYALKTISSGAFKFCSSLKSITIPDSVIYIGGGAFERCDSLESITLTFVGQGPVTPEDGTQYPFGYIFGTTGYPYCDKIRETEQTYALGNKAWGTTYMIPISLKSVTINSDYIPYGAFSKCKDINTITFGKKDITIGDFAFKECTLGSFVYPGTNDEWNSIPKGDLWDWGIGIYIINCADGSMSNVN